MPISRQFITSMFLHYFDTSSFPRRIIEGAPEIYVYHQALESSAEPQYVNVLCGIIHGHLHWRISGYSYLRSAIAATTSSTVSATHAMLKKSASMVFEAAKTTTQTACSSMAGFAETMVTNALIRRRPPLQTLQRSPHLLLRSPDDSSSGRTHRVCSSDGSDVPFALSETRDLGRGVCHDRSSSVMRERLYTPESLREHRRHDRPAPSGSFSQMPLSPSQDSVSSFDGMTRQSPFRPLPSRSPEHSESVSVSERSLKPFSPSLLPPPLIPLSPSSPIPPPSPSRYVDGSPDFDAMVRHGFEIVDEDYSVENSSQDPRILLFNEIIMHIFREDPNVFQTQIMSQPFLSVILTISSNQRFLYNQLFLPYEVVQYISVNQR